MALAGDHQIVAGGAVAIDGPTLFLQGTILLLAIPGVLSIAERSLDRGGAVHLGRLVAAGLASTSGCSPPPVSPRPRSSRSPCSRSAACCSSRRPNDLLTMFVALEVLSLPLYLLCGLARRRRLLCQEASLKYFLLGAFSSAFFLYGVALLYGYAGTVRLSGIADGRQHQHRVATRCW